MKRFLLFSLFFLPALASAVTFPASTPSGETPGGVFYQFFRNAAENPCPANHVVMGFQSGALNFMTPRCVAMETLAGGWLMSGNAGLNTSVNFLGTTDLVDLIFRTNNVERMRVTSGGNVSIATTTPTPGYKLDVNGKSYFRDDVTSNGQFLASASDLATAPGFTWITDPNTGFFNANADTIGFATAGFERMRLMSNGNLAIGTGSALQKLHVNGNAQLDGRTLLLGTNQTIYGDNNTAIYIDSGNPTSTQLILRDANNISYGRLVGSSSGSSFGLVDGDNSWGIHMEKDQYTRFLINNSEKIRFLSGGNIGIGTTNPVSALTIINDDGVGSVGLVNSTDLDIAAFSGQDLEFGHINTNGTIANRRMTIDADGSIGIATTTPTPGYKLDVNGKSYFRDDVTSNGQFLASASDLATAPGFTWITDPNTGFFNANADTIGFATAGFERMRLMSNGNLAIGTGSALQKLHVNGNAQLDGRSLFFGSVQTLYGDNSSALYWDSNHTSISQLIFRDVGNIQYGRVYGSDTGASFGLMDGDGHWSYLAAKDQYTAFIINNSEKMRISSGGILSIATTTPTPGYKLDVNGKSYFRDDVTSNGQFLASASDLATAPGFTWITDPNTGFFNANADTIGFATAGFERMRIGSTGNIGIGQTSPSYKLDVNGTFRFTGDSSATTPDDANDIATKGYVDSQASGLPTGYSEAYANLGEDTYITISAGIGVSPLYTTNTCKTNYFSSNKAYLCPVGTSKTCWDYYSVARANGDEGDDGFNIQVTCVARKILVKDM